MILAFVFILLWAISTTLVGLVILVVGGAIVAALDTLNANIQQLSADVQAIPNPQVGGATEVEVQAAADAVAAVDAVAKSKQAPVA